MFLRHLLQNAPSGIEITNQGTLSSTETECWKSLIPTTGHFKLLFNRNNFSPKQSLLPFKIDAGGYIMRRVLRTMHINRLKRYKGGKETHPLDSVWRMVAH